jgi:uncharacterized protein YraI
MHRLSVFLSFAVLLLAPFGIASAQDAYTSRPMNVRAGPDREYPLVAQLGPGAPVDVRGCLSDWSWCDVSFDGNRGWVYAGGLSFVYQGARVPLYSYGPQLGLPIITFSLGTYWNQYYRGRPWYGQRDTWAHRRMPPHMRPPGRPGMAPMQRPQERPMPRTHMGGRPTPHEQPPAGGRPAARSEERGHAGPPAGRESPQRGHAPPSNGDRGSRGRSDHEEHGNRPPSSDH